MDGLHEHIGWEDESMAINIGFLDICSEWYYIEIKGFLKVVVIRAADQTSAVGVQIKSLSALTNFSSAKTHPR